MKKNDEGFTLIELLIVIVILGILATVVVFAVGGITEPWQESAPATPTRSTLEVAVEAYNAQYGVYPAVAGRAGPGVHAQGVGPSTRSAPAASSRLDHRHRRGLHALSST